MKTSKDYTIADYRGYGEITVPAGTALTHTTAMGFDAKYHFVADLTFIRKNYPQFHEMQLLHDAMHYGIDVPVEYVDYELATTKDIIIEKATEPQIQYTLSLNGIALYTGTKKECVSKVNQMPTLDYNSYKVEPSAPVDEPMMDDEEPFKPIYDAISNKDNKLAKNLINQLTDEQFTQALAHFDAVLHYDVVDNGEDGEEDYKNFVHTLNVLRTPQNIYIVCYTSISDEMDYYYPYTEGDALSDATAHYNELLQDADVALANLCKVIKSTDYTFQSQQIS